MVAGVGRDQEPAYTQEELEQLDIIREVLMSMPAKDRWRAGNEALRALWPDVLDYIRHTYVIKTKVIGERVLFKPNYAQRRMWDDVIEPAIRANRPLRVIILKARQLGFSTFIQMLFYAWCELESVRNAITVSYSEDSTVELFQKTIFTRRHHWFPWPHRRDRSNKLELTNESSMHAQTAGTDTVGRSHTFHYAHCSEVPMWVDADEAFTSLLQAVPDQPGTCIFIESTARGATGPFYDQWRAAERGESGYAPFFAPWFWDPEYVIDVPVDARRAFEEQMDFDERLLVSQFKLTLEQLHWRRRCIKDKCAGSVKKFQQEYPSTAEEAFLTSGSPCFDAHAVARLAQNARPALWTGEISLLKPRTGGESFECNLVRTPAGHLRIWDHADPGREYVIGADVAEGRVRDKNLSARRKLISYGDRQPDYSSASVVELHTGLHVASWHGTVNPHEFASILHAMGLHFNNALLVVEVNGPGYATVICLVEQMRYPKMYRTRQYAVSEASGLATEFGWRTLPQTREQLMFQITQALDEGNLFTRDAKLIDEMRTMERDPNGLPRAMGSNKDDRVFSFALAMQGRYDVFGGRQERPGTQRAVKRSPDQWVWDHVQAQMEQSARERSGGGAGRRFTSPRHLGDLPRRVL